MGTLCNSHQGVCLVLDFPAVCEALDDGIAIKVGRQRIWGRIQYIDKPIQLDVTGGFADRATLDQALHEFVERRYKMSGLHMTKNTDWEYETELRLAVLDYALDDTELDTPVNLPLRDCLKAVIFGDAYAPSPLSTARGIRSALSAHPPEFFQCYWTGGMPWLEDISF
ncbi:hypothetical protein [Mycobacterium sp.]|uniref:DUF2971 domain-containing protein n=1 Tax=Mycobacterium sp. TaxID=1785 RepID=UPI003D106973